MTHSLKYLPQKYEFLCLGPDTHKKLELAHVPALGRWRQKAPQRFLVNQLSQSLSYGLIERNNLKK